MYVSHETLDATERRLCDVIRAASFQTWQERFAFEEYPLSGLPVDATSDALALVRDDDVWSVLRPAGVDAVERFGIFAFHFADALDNSGFVGWLASRIKRDLGAGVFVICGQNSRRGGIFDYWGVPEALTDDVVALIADLRAASATA